VEKNIERQVNSFPWLSLESVGEGASISLAFEKDNKIIIKSEIIGSRKAVTNDLLTRIKKIVANNFLELNDLKKFILIKGPGSFTGLRVATSLLHGLALGLNKEVFSLTLFELFTFAWLVMNKIDGNEKKLSVSLEVIFKSRLGEFFAGNVESIKLESSVDDKENPSFFPWYIQIKNKPRIVNTPQASKIKDNHDVLFCPEISKFDFSGLQKHFKFQCEINSLSSWAIMYKFFLKTEWDNAKNTLPSYVREKVAQTIIEREYESSIYLRNLNLEDLPLLNSIENDAYDFGWSEKNFTDALKAGYVAKGLINNSILVGYFFWQKAVDECHLLNFTIAKDRQNRGLGKYLLEKLLDVLKKNSFNSIFLEVRPSNNKAIGLYSRFGFSIIGRRRDYYPAKHNREDALVMKRLVNLK
jgi:ribosomal-protein-alanine N-acetyltransferase